MNKLNPVTDLQRRLCLNRRQLAVKLSLSLPYLAEVDAGIVKDPRKFNAAVATLNLDLNDGGANG